VAAVDQGQHLDCGRTTAVDQRVERCPKRPSGEEHIVDDDHHRAVDPRRRAPVDVVKSRVRRCRARSVVAVRTRIEGGNRRRRVAQAFELARDRTRKGNPASRDPDEHHAVQQGMTLSNLVRKPQRDALHGSGIEQLRAVLERLCEPGHRSTVMRAASRAPPS
jgi:hypothetical protein